MRFFNVCLPEVFSLERCFSAQREAEGHLTCLYLKKMPSQFLRPHGVSTTRGRIYDIYIKKGISMTKGIDLVEENGLCILLFVHFRRLPRINEPDVQIFPPPMADSILVCLRVFSFARRKPIS